MSKAKSAKATKEKKPVIRETYWEQNNLLTLGDFVACRGAFRPRIIRWNANVQYEMSPYAMGMLAYICAHSINFLPLTFSQPLHGYGSKFRPPEEWRDVFLKAYEITGDFNGAYLTAAEYTPGNFDLFQYTFSGSGIAMGFVSAPRDLGVWNRRLSGMVAGLQEIHDMLTHLGAPDLTPKEVKHADSNTTVSDGSADASNEQNSEWRADTQASPTGRRVSQQAEQVPAY